MSAIDDIISRLTSPYNHDPTSNNYKLLSIFADEYDEIETTISDIKSAHFVDSATGTSLDNLGILLQTFRETAETDAHYRIRLKTMWARYIGSGTIQDVLDIVAAMLAVETNRIEVIEDFVGVYANFDVWVWLQDMVDVGITTSDLNDLLGAVKGAGISVAAHAYGTFTARAAADPNDSTLGYDDIAHSNPTGGTYSGIIT
ncbi:MAG: hypothetical protein KAJ93_07240 [Methanosarcinales archaeon]|nr:hypothetical protein [Methanosarcinales archaeon]